MPRACASTSGSAGVYVSGGAGERDSGLCSSSTKRVRERSGEGLSVMASRATPVLCRKHCSAAPASVELSQLMRCRVALSACCCAPAAAIAVAMSASTSDASCAGLEA
eukprot:2114-Heterococcus_DN1.PRE.3